MRKKIQRAGALLLAILLFLTPLRASASENVTTMERIENSIAAALEWCRGENTQIFTAEFKESLGNSVSDWLAITVGRLGVEDDYEGALLALEQYVTNAYQIEELLHFAKSTEWHRISLAVLALGGDPTCFGTDKEGKPINLIADGVYDRGKVNSLGAQGVNGWIWGLITLDSMRYEIPEGSFYTREDILSEILKLQEENGVIPLMPETPDVDITAMALQALAPYYEESLDIEIEDDGESRIVNTADAVDAALCWLSENQLDNGGYSYYGSENAESTAQVIVALCSLGIDPMEDERFIKNGNTLLDALLSFQQASGGFYHADDGTGENLMATEQSMYALCALYRQQMGYRTLYDFREDETETSGLAENIAEARETASEDTGLEEPLQFVIIVTGAAVGVVLISGALAAALLHRKNKKRKKKEEIEDDSW